MSLIDLVPVTLNYTVRSFAGICMLDDTVDVPLTKNAQSSMFFPKLRSLK